MSRIRTRFDSLAARRARALIGYIVAGDATSGPGLMRALTAGGADVIELGMPFSDPMAEGPIIQRAHERALSAGTSVPGVLEQAAAFRRVDEDTPVVLMGYLNPLERYGCTAFAADARTAGVDAVLCVDCPAGERSPLERALEAEGLEKIQLIAPTTAPGRCREILTHASGFAYAITLRGVTGAADLEVEAVRARTAELKALSDIPVVAGFGIKSPGDAARLSEVCDGVVIGSALVGAVGGCDNAEAAAVQLEMLMHSYRTAIDSGNPA
ncbi:MAG: tryptophan synthase subunit alpha [Gammaproteobacteria bacterium AqS3]|nr:tryptophan synthase subunit alpha [Gammaproteobacteria bacterium AqS3]